jgi:hypothetical protein
MNGLFSLGNRFLKRGSAAPQTMRPNGPQAWGGQRDPFWNYDTAAAATPRESLRNIAMSLIQPRRFGGGGNR